MRVLRTVAILWSRVVMLYVEIVCFVREYFWGTKNGVEADGNCGALHRKPVSLTTRISLSAYCIQT